VSFSDDDDFSLFKTRDGRATGHANERTMLDVVGGKRTIRTQIRDNPDGSTTRLKTRGGFAEFVTTEPKKESPKPKRGPFLYYKLASSEHPFGWGIRADGRMSNRWQWPGYPVSYSEVRDSTAVLNPQAFKSSDGPGTMTWEDTRQTPQIKAVLSWSPAFGNGRSAPTNYMAGVLDSVWPSSPMHNYTFDGGSSSDPPGKFLPGQKMTGANGHLRFVQAPLQTFLYEDGESTGIFGYILAACIVAGQTERWRTIEFVPRQTASENLVLKAKAYRADGTFVSSSNVTMNLPNFSKLTEMIQPPRFNSSGTQAVGIVRYTKTGDHGGGVAVIVIDWAGAQANVGPTYDASYQEGNYNETQDYPLPYWLSYNLGFTKTETLVVTTPLIADYAGDDIRLLWTKQTVSFEGSRSVNYDQYSLSQSATSRKSKTMALYLDGAILESVSSTEEGDASSSIGITVSVIDPERPWNVYESGSESSGSMSITHSASSFITDVMADLRKGIIAFCVETFDAYESQSSGAISASRDLGYPAIITWTSEQNVPAVTATARIKLISGGVETVTELPGVISAESTTSTNTTQSIRVDTLRGLIVFGGDLHINSGLFVDIDKEESNWASAGRALNSQLVESLSMAVDKTGSTIFISGLLCNGLTKVFTPFAKIIRNGGVSNMPVSEVLSDDGQPSYIWVSEPIFLDVEVKP